MKVAYFNGGFGVTSETFISDLVDQLRASGVELILGSERAGGGAEVLKFEQRCLGDRALAWFAKLSRGRLDYLDAYRSAPSAIRRVEAFIAVSKPDVAYIDFATSAVLLAPILQRVGIPFVFHVHGVDITASLRNPYFAEKIQSAFSSAEAVIAASNHIRKLLVLVGCPAAKIRLIRYEPNVDELQAMPIVDRSKHPSVVALGRLTPKKHPVALIHAFARVHQALPDVRFTLIGDGELREQVLDCIRYHRLEGVIDVHGALLREEALKLVQRHWVFAQHSVTAVSGDQEGFAISPAEAALMGLPVVSTWHNGIPEQVEHGETGYLVPEHDFERMGERLIQLLENPEQVELMGRAGRERISSLCRSGRRVADVVDLLQAAADR